jgi:hypothetical protein
MPTVQTGPDTKKTQLQVIKSDEPEKIIMRPVDYLWYVFMHLTLVLVFGWYYLMYYALR